MKLLLTSAGVTNQKIADALLELAGKNLKVAFVTTAANVEEGNKDWYLGQIDNLRKFGFDWIDIVDPSAAAVDWRTRLSQVGIIFISGGNTFHLLDQYRKTGLADWLNKNLNKFVYVGVSAGTIVATPCLDVCNIPPSDANLPGLTDLTALGWVNFEVEPHCDTKRFVTMKKWAEEENKIIYAIDDDTAIQVVGSKVEVLSAGKWELYNG